MAEFKKFKAGDDLAIPAKQANAWTDAAIEHLRNRFSTSRPETPPPPPANIVRVRNDSGSDRKQFDILGVDGPLFAPVTNDSSLAAFRKEIALKGVTPVEAGHTGRFVVLAEPIRAGAVGRAWIAGATICKVAITSEDDTVADVTDGDVTKLTSGSGAATLLWIEPPEDRETAGVAWCVVRFGGAGGQTASVSVTEEFPALLTHVEQCADVAGLPEYHWVEALLNGCIAGAKTGGRTSEPTYTVTEFTQVGELDTDAPQLVFPVAGSTLPGTVTPGSPDTIAIEFEWSAENGGSTDNYFLGVGEPPFEVWPTSTWDVYQEENTDLGNVQTYEVTGIPADARTIAVRVWNNVSFNDYTFKIVVSGGGLATGTEDLNALARGDTVPEPEEYGGVDWVPAAKTAMTTSVLALVQRHTDADGNSRYLFVRGVAAEDTSGFLAWLTEVSVCDDQAAVRLPAYGWVEAQLMACAAQSKPGGKTSEQFVVENFAHIDSSLPGTGSAVEPDAPQLLFPADASVLPGAVTPGSPPTIAIQFQWTAVPGPTGTDNYWLGVGTDADTNLYHDENTPLGLVTVLEVSGIPTEGVTVVVTVWNDTKFNQYSFDIAMPDRRCILTEDETLVRRLIEPPAPDEFDNSGTTWIPTDPEALTTPVLVWMQEHADAEGKARFVATRGGAGGGGAIECGPTNTSDYVKEFDETTCQRELRRITWVKIGECDGESVYGRLGAIVDPEA